MFRLALHICKEQTIMSYCLGVVCKIARDTISYVMSALTGRIFMTYDIYIFFSKSVEKIQV